MKRELYLWDKEEKWNEELNEAWANLGEHGFDKEATYVSRKVTSAVVMEISRKAISAANKTDEVRMPHWLITVERRDGWDGVEPHFRVGYYNAAPESAIKHAGQWLTDESQQKEIDWDWTSDNADLYEMEYKTWDDLLNDNGFRPWDESRMNAEAKSIKEHGMTRYEMCWDELHSQMVKQSQTIHGGGWPVFVLDRMERIENEILSPQEEEE